MRYDTVIAANKKKSIKLNFVSIFGAFERKPPQGFSNDNLASV